MIIRFGYVSHALDLWEATPAKTMTFARYKKLGHEAAIKQLHKIAEMNLERTRRIIHYNIAREIHLYRFSSSIIPLATHDEVEWDYIEPFRHLFEEIGELVRAHNMRTSFHPNQFTLFTSDRPHVTDNAVQDMEYHYAMLKAMGLHNESHINLHVGGAYGDKQAAVARFHENVKKLPAPIKQQMTLENDDKTYTTTETLDVCEKEEIPMMFDYHHYMANHTEDEPLSEILPRFYKTWDRLGLPPKIHISSPKSEKAYRSHADFVDADFIRPLLKELKALNTPVDFMIEAKEKDRALLKLVEDFSSIRGVKRVGEATLDV
ncbi:UV DNA damage repair endonuclease UvsE [Halobacillus sp. Nhm2S1]|uniref:UV DNA damage repair endonuclease UvsE n=1 Tax=Halobacillus sp. Nhm2S1 TaxID=2866716 RepID=UPI001C72E94F|nr:UV DNA damage repair endonuclease UvsE [Halobacillus sp. Nhm2S1]MBX0359769.1 UV DNA damage repair endonuclease UvsE [Halobacillus sp. Nhm2S1]